MKFNTKKNCEIEGLGYEGYMGYKICEGYKGYTG